MLTLRNGVFSGRESIRRGGYLVDSFFLPFPPLCLSFWLPGGWGSPMARGVTVILFYQNLSFSLFPLLTPLFLPALFHSSSFPLSYQSIITRIPFFLSSFLSTSKCKPPCPRKNYLHVPPTSPTCSFLLFQLPCGGVLKVLLFYKHTLSQFHSSSLSYRCPGQLP